MFYGSPGNLLLPGLARTMGEGWETARRRDDGNDWVLVRLGRAGTRPAGRAGHVVLHGQRARLGPARRLPGRRRRRPDRRPSWFDLLPRVRCSPTPGTGSWSRRTARSTHVRLDVYPDGGMARLRVWGDLV